MINLLNGFKNKLFMQLPVAHARRMLHNYQPLTRPILGRNRQLLVDVSVIVQSDARTGIQRVVRAVLSELQSQLPWGFDLCPVFATKKQAYHYAGDFSEKLGLTRVTEKNCLVKTAPGDIFLGLDLAAHILPRRTAQIERWKKNGVKMHVVVYDLLPLLSPEWFYKKTVSNFQRWLRTISVYADSMICISNTVRHDVERMLGDSYSLAGASAPTTHVIRLGSDIEASLPSSGIAAEQRQLVDQLTKQPTILVVGTLEPRKGHLDILHALEKLWQQNANVNLVFCGKPGWKTELLQQKILQHTYLNQKLFWFSDCSDELLGEFYRKCRGVIVASMGEGFGLPLVEAMRFSRAVLARDIPVFREIAGNQVDYFVDSKPLAFSSTIQSWLEQAPEKEICRNFMSFTWRDTVRTLLSQIVSHDEVQRSHGYQSTAMSQLKVIDGKL